MGTQGFSPFFIVFMMRWIKIHSCYALAVASSSCSSVLIRFYPACISICEPSILSSCEKCWLTVCKHCPVILDTDQTVTAIFQERPLCPGRTYHFNTEYHYLVAYSEFVKLKKMFVSMVEKLICTAMDSTETIQIYSITEFITSLT